MKSDQWWSASIIFVVSLTMIGSGLFTSMSGPTLLYLVDNVSSDVSSVSYVLSSRAAGYLLGSVICSLLIHFYKNYNSLLTIGAGILVCGGLMLITPWVHSLAGLIVSTAVSGTVIGYCESGAQSLYIQLFGEKKSRPYLQSFHFFFGIGAFLAPVIAAPFLEMADQQGSAEESCPAESYSSLSSLSTTAATTGDSNFNPVGWAYVLSGSFTLLTGVLNIALALLGAENKVKKKKKDDDKDEEAGVKPEEPIRDVMWLFLPILCYYFVVVCLELLYQSYVYSVALCSDLAFSVSDSASLNTLFWIGFMIGRGSCIYLSTIFQPKILILYALLGTTLSTVILSAFGEKVPPIIWFVTFFYGFCVGPFYSSGISWASQITNVSSGYIFIFALGMTIGSVTMPILAGELFEIDAFSVVYLWLGLAVVNILVVFWMFEMGKRHKAKSSSNKNAPTSKQSTRM